MANPLLGVHGFCLQTGSAGRGIGRYASRLVAAIAAADVDVLLYHDANRPPPPLGPYRLTPGGGPRWRDVLADNPDNCDALLETSPFEIYSGHVLDPPVSTCRSIATVFYDLIPYIWPERYLCDPGIADLYRRGVAELAKWPRLLALSRHGATEATRLLHVPADAVSVIGAAHDPFFRPGAATRLPAGIGARPFVFYAGQTDHHKNPEGAFNAFFGVAEPQRRGLDFVVLCPSLSNRPHYLNEFRRRAPTSRLFCLAHIDDVELLSLYRTCLCYVCTSRYEGFGLPALEALACGAPVIAANNTAQPEVVGGAGILCDAEKPAEFSAAIERLASRPGDRSAWVARGVLQARGFTWPGVAARTKAALGLSAATPAVAAPFSPPVAAMPPATPAPAFVMPVVPATRAVEWAPEDGFPLGAEYSIAQRSRELAGARIAAASTAAICSLARNVGDRIDRFRRVATLFGGAFRETRFYVYENDSHDDTPVALRRWFREEPRLRLWTEAKRKPVWPRARDLARGAAMAEARNVYRDAIVADGVPDYVIVMDSDMQGWSFSGLLDSLGRDAWDMLGANGIGFEQGRWVQYDAWAWRDPGHRAPHSQREINPRFYPRGGPLVPVSCCFGGMAIYRGAAFAASRYAGGDIEHAPFHFTMADAGYGRLFMNPSLVTLL